MPTVVGTNWARIRRLPGRRRWLTSWSRAHWHLERYPGKYVAIDMTTGVVVLAADTPQELEAAIKEQGLKNVATMRALHPDEPLFVGAH